MKKEALEKVLLAVLFLGMLVYCYITYLLSPELSSLEKLNTELQAQQGRYEQLLVYQGDKIGLQEEIKRLESENAALNAQIPSSFDRPQIMMYIYSVAKSAHVEPVSLNFEASKSSEEVQSMVLSFSGLGKINDILAFTKKIQFEGTQKLGIQSINLVNQNGMIKAEIKFVAYATNQSSENPSKPSTLPTGQGLSTIEQMFKP